MSKDNFKKKKRTLMPPYCGLLPIYTRSFCWFTSHPNPALLQCLAASCPRSQGLHLTGLSRCPPIPRFGASWLPCDLSSLMNVTKVTYLLFVWLFFIVEWQFSPSLDRAAGILVLQLSVPPDCPWHHTCVCWILGVMNQSWLKTNTVPTRVYSGCVFKPCWQRNEQ